MVYENFKRISIKIKINYNQNIIIFRFIFLNKIFGFFFIADLSSWPKWPASAKNVFSDDVWNQMLINGYNGYKSMVNSPCD